MDQDAAGIRAARPGPQVGTRPGRDGLPPGPGRRGHQRRADRADARPRRPVPGRCRTPRRCRCPACPRPGSPATGISPELRSLLRRVKLGQLLPALPERLALARAHDLGHAEFLELLLSDEVTRRDATSAERRARAAGLDPAMRLDNFDPTAAITYDRRVLEELFALRFVADGCNALIM